jgi:hypothetical protein
MLKAVGNPMMTPWPTYDKLGVKVHNQFLASGAPNSGIAKMTGKKYARSYEKP